MQQVFCSSFFNRPLLRVGRNSKWQVDDVLVCPHEREFQSTWFLLFRFQGSSSIDGIGKLLRFPSRQVFVSRLRKSEEFGRDTNNGALCRVDISWPCRLKRDNTCELPSTD